jgi:hypothetical protein
MGDGRDSIVAFTGRGRRPGTDAPPRVAPAHAARTRRNGPSAGSPGAGFGHLCNGGDRQIVPFSFQGRPVDTEDAVQMRALRVAMRKLAFALERFKDDELPAHREPHADKPARENPTIPAGYTYLLQLVSHDLVHSATSLSLTGDRRSALHNARTSHLRLQTIYGEGPIASPLIYRRRAANDSGVDPCVFALRLGSLRDPERRVLTGVMRDIGRANVGCPVQHEGAATSLPDALIADERNDDHVIISQLTTLFHLLHNGLVAILAESDKAEYAEDDEEAAFDRYFAARMATTLMFRRVLRNDLLRRWLNPTVYAAYANGEALLLGPTHGRIPLEFSHGAMRCGHAMVRDVYTVNRRFGATGINELLHLSSARRPHEMPLTHEWAVQWSQFFEVDVQAPLSSMRIAPRYSQLLRDSAIFRSQDPTGKDGLAYRDLLSATMSGLWSVPALIKRIRELPTPVASLLHGHRLYDDAQRAEDLAAWLHRYNSPSAENRLTDEEIEQIAAEPPLPFFLMFEALTHPDSEGLRLGPLASIIVADTLFGIFTRDPLVADEFDVPTRTALTPFAPVYMSQTALADLPTIDSMPDLVRFVASLHRFETTAAGQEAPDTPPFL